MKSVFSTSLMRVFLSLICMGVIASCNTDKDDGFAVPSTYDFTRNGISTVNYSGQTERLDMLALMGTYMKSSNTIGAAALDENLLNQMFSNTGDPFDGQTFAKDLKSKCFLPDTTVFKQLFHDLAVASLSDQPATSGVAGVMVTGSSDSLVGYRVDGNGIELTQVILKGLMGSVFFYQAMDVYLTEERMGTNGNTELVEGENYTQMEHYFDEAFGYFGIPEDFPNVVTLEDARFWGEYINKRDGGLYSGINAEMSLAFRTARAAIVAQDYQTRDEEIQHIMQIWAKVIAASAVDYLGQAKSTNSLAQYKRHHVLSEAIGFMMALKYHFNGGNSKFPPHYSFSQIETALQTIGLNSDLYTVSDTDIDNVITAIKAAFPEGEIK